MIWLFACATPADSAVDPCDELPYADWETFGSRFTVQNCRTCHSVESTSRGDAPEEVNFDTAEDVWEWADRVLERAGAEPPTMPPLGGTTEGDREMLRAWLECGAEGS